MFMKPAIYIKLMLVLLSLVTVFHLCILAKLIPYNIAWGGNLKTDLEMYVFETISILVNLFLMLVLAIKGSYVKWNWNEKVVNGILWIFFFVFVLNTVGNIVAKTNFEKTFSLLTLAFAVLLWQILKKRKLKYK